VSRIICNSGPLIALGILARLDILKSLFDEVLVPEAVQKEIEQGGIKLSGLEDFRRGLDSHCAAQGKARRTAGIVAGHRRGGGHQPRARIKGVAGAD